MPVTFPWRILTTGSFWILRAAADHESLCNGDMVGDKDNTMLCDEQDVKTCSQFYTLAGGDTYLQCGLSGQYCLNMGPLCKKASYGTVEIQGRVYEKFWWYKKGTPWPVGKTDVLGEEFGTCEDEDEVCFQRLPSKLTENGLFLLAIDDLNNQLEWHFDPDNPVAHAAFNAMKHGTTSHFVNGAGWDPRILRGSKTANGQDTFMYRDQNGIRSLMLDDDGCDCHSTLSMGHAMCGDSCNDHYGKCKILGGVDKLSDRAETGGEGSGKVCTGPATDHGLTLYYYHMEPIPTCGGTAEGADCRFPFYFKGKQYFECTEVESAGKPWCYTQNGKKKWGFCKCNEAERKCHTFVNWRKRWLGSQVEITMGNVAYGSYVGSWQKCLLLCERAKECKQVVFYNGHCYGMNARSDEDQDARGGKNVGFISAHCYEEGDFALVPNKVCKGKPYTFDKKSKCDGWGGLTIEQCQQKCADNEQALHCPPRACKGAVFYRKTGWCHLYEQCTELEDRPSATAIIEKIEHDCSNAVQDIGERQRTYSSVWNNNEPGQGHARSMMGSLLAWCSRTNVDGSWMQIDLGIVASVTGVVTKGRVDRGQWVTAYSVQTSTDGKRFIDAPGGTGGNLDQHSENEVYFTFPVEARYVRIVAHAWHSHISMRASVILCQAVATCEIRVDDDVTAVYYDGKDVSKSVQGSLSGYRSVRRLTFQLVPGAVLAVGAYDAQKNLGYRGGFWADCPGFMSKDNLPQPWEQYCTDGKADKEHLSGAGSGWKASYFAASIFFLPPGVLGELKKGHCVYRATPLKKEAERGEVRCHAFATHHDAKNWARKCHAVPSGTQYVKLVMGEVTDYFKPSVGYSFCDMLTSYDKHLFSNDAENWAKPEYYPHHNHDGGSLWWWPKQTQSRHGDERKYLSFWGSSWPGTTWGCCHYAYNDAVHWGRIFTMSYCGVNLKPAFECTDYPTSSGSAQQRCEAGNTLKDGFEYVYNTGRYKAYSECSSRDCWCCRRSTAVRKD
ncbi:unnamed protein product [Effrenium voratum]|uniref:F5/8 type C domain-containing protein n=1 Tax=Effrenium voratum TaxID=2562239 RepID=A0AA36IY83_9DINO|nr:unnamed protein product [Effrenium voratum]